jgi:HPt (histidine-containing phosphotransfer) domain-containing protein
MNDFDARMTELRARFAEEAKKDRERLIKALADDDYHLIRSIAHSMAGRAGLFGFPEVSEKAAALESALDNEPAQLRWCCDALLESLAFVNR